MAQHWLVVGTKKNWETSFKNGNIWGLKDFRELAALWNLLQEGDRILLYVSSPVSGIVGCGTVSTKFRQTKPLWPEEIRRGQVVWPLRFEFDLEYCLAPNLWESRAYKETNLQLITRMVFQCIPESVVQAVRKHLALPTLQELPLRNPSPAKRVSEDISHNGMRAQLAEAGRIQGFLAEEEYPIDGNRLDVVWRRVERSVPTYAFEIQVAGDMYHAVAKLKRAFDLWNSRIFLAGKLQDRARFEELVGGTFHEIRERARFIELGVVADLCARKREYKAIEKELGLFP